MSKLVHAKEWIKTNYSSKKFAKGVMPVCSVCQKLTCSPMMFNIYTRIYKCYHCWCQSMGKHEAYLAFGEKSEKYLKDSLEEELSCCMCGKEVPEHQPLLCAECEAFHSKKLG